ncbi:MAG: glycosyltransferase [Elusimicrobiales bacterium]|nr:glycosyltransferase [Elusimicrobiales bacterium]
MDIKKLSVIVPCYNEFFTIGPLLDKVNAVRLPGGMKKEVVIVDDCSRDGTRELLRDRLSSTKYSGIDELKIIYQEKNQGKGAAIIRAIPECAGDYTIIQDADLEYNPEEWSALLEPVFKNDADAVYGSRFKGTSTRALYYWHALGNKFLTTLSNIFSNLYLTDMETCYKLVRTDILKSLNLESRRFGIEPEITAKLAKLRDLSIYEVPISYSGRTYSEGKKINYKDGIAAVYFILKYNLFPGQVLRNAQEDILYNMDSSRHYEEMLEFLKPHIGRDVLEIGCGKGALTARLVKLRKNLVCMDINDKLLARLRLQYGHIPSLEIRALDARDIKAAFGPERFDTVIAFNLMEHLPDDAAFAQDIRTLLKPGGKFIGVVPAYQAIFNEIDKAVEHRRRYDFNSLAAVLRGYSGLEIRRYNSLSIPGWVVTGGLLRRKYIPKMGVWLNNSLLALTRLADRLTGHKIGLNILFIAEK